MPTTARKHFNEDITRAKSILQHAYGLTGTSNLLREDLFRSSWMFAVGAMDAYFCDAYADMMARSLRAKNMQRSINLPRFIEDKPFPVSAIFMQVNSRENWRWRMAAREMIERENVLSLSKVQNLFNPFLREKYRILNSALIDDLIIKKKAPMRLTGITRNDYRSKPKKEQARKKAKDKVFKRFSEICQRRHDCIHNCDRPKQKTTKIYFTHVDKVIKDIDLIACLFDETFENEFTYLLHSMGADAKTRNATGY